MSSVLALMAAAIFADEEPPPDGSQTPVNLSVDGNSIYASGDGTLAYHLSLQPALAGRDITYESSAIGGQNWLNMTTDHSDLDATWVEGRRNILIAGETGNDAFYYNAAQIKAHVVDYLTAIKAVHPWEVILVGTTPRYFVTAEENATYVSLNQIMTEVDTWMSVNWQTLGAIDYVDMRVIPMFNDDGTHQAVYQAYIQNWGDNIHPNYAGKEIMAAYLAQRLIPILDAEPTQPQSAVYPSETTYPMEA